MSLPSFENLKFELQPNGVATVTLNRPTKLNALNIETIAELGAVFDYIYDAADIKAVVLTGEGEKAFAAGADIAEIANLNEVTARKFAENGQEAFAKIESCSKPVIAAINGFALGGGCELAMACHIRVATKNAKFGQPEVNLGLIPGYGGTQRLTHLVGKGRALELMLTGDMVNAEEAHRIGLVNHVCEDREQMNQLVEGMLKKILAKAPIALGLVIESVNAAFCAEEAGYQTEANSFMNACKSEDFREGTSAFLEKREAHFKNK